MTGGRNTARLVTAFLLVLGCATSLWVEWPGTYVYDSYLQLIEGRSGSYSFWHPPVMSWLLGLADSLMPGATLFVLVQTLLGFLGLIAIVWLPRRVSWWAVPVAVLACLAPQFLLYQGYVLKDVLLANAALAGFVALGLSAAFWRETGWRLFWILLAGLFLLLALLARQNGILFLLFGALSLTAIALRCGSGVRAAALAGLCFFFLVAGCGKLATAAFELRHDGTPATAIQFRLLHAYDITGIIARHPDYALDVLTTEAPQLEKEIRAAGAQYTPARNDTLVADAPFSKALENSSYDVVARQWRALMLDHPVAWLAQRAEVFGWLVLPSHIDQCHPYYVGAKGPADALKTLGLQERMDGRDWVLFSLGAWLSHTPVFWHVLYGIVAFLVMLFCFCRRRPADIAVGCYMAGALAFTASFFVISIACDYRYIYALDVSAIAGLLYLAASVSRRSENRRIY